jgi:DNA modification methylase
MSKLILINGSCVEWMWNPDNSGSVHLIVTSPPYDDLRAASYGGKGSWNFQHTARGISDVLCDGGVCCWNVGDSVIDGSESLTSFKQAIYFVEECGLRLHDTMIYEKCNFSNPSSNRYHQMFEYVFILSKGSPRCFNPIKDKPNAWAGTGTFGKNTIREADGTMGERKRNIVTEFGQRGNVWKGKTRGQEEMCNALPHPAMMPKWLARDLIISWSNEGDTVLDPFAGSGTTPAAALNLGRNAVAIEANPEYIPIIADSTGTSENHLALFQ